MITCHQQRHSYSRDVTHPRFFSAQPLPRPPAGTGSLDVSEEVARHLQVLRVGAGDPVTLFDGLGGEWHAVVAAIGKRAATLQLRAFDPVERESPLAITLVQALATSDKMDFIVQKAVELGVHALQPVASERATLKLTGERAQKRVAHWQAIAQAACEQCGRNRVPAVADVIDFDAWLALPATGARVILHPQGEVSLAACASSLPMALAVGPEGGFSDQEIARAAARGVTCAGLGPRVLRAETAGMAALATLNALKGDFR